jgi:MFS family permease
MLVSAAQQFHRNSLPAVADQVMRDCSISEQSMGALLSLFFFSYTCLMIPGGWLADRIGTWWTLLLVVSGSSLFGGLLGVPGLLALSPAAALCWFAGSRGLMGVVSAPLYPSTARAASNWFSPESRLWANALVIGAALFGIAAAQIGMSRLSLRFGWPKAFAIAGGATLVVVLLWAIWGRDSPAGRRSEVQPSGGRSWAALLKHRGLLALTLSYGSVGYVEYFLFNWIKYYYKEILELEEETSAFLSLCALLTMMVTAPVGGLICARLARAYGLRAAVRLLSMPAMVLSAVFLVLAGLVSDSPDPTLLGICLALALGSIGASEGPYWTAAVILGGRHGATAGGVLNTGGNLIGSVAPLLTPVIAAWLNAAAGTTDTDRAFGWTGTLYVTSAVCLAGVIFWLWVDVEKPVADRVTDPLPAGA